MRPLSRKDTSELIKSMLIIISIMVKWHDRDQLDGVLQQVPEIVAGTEAALL